MIYLSARLAAAGGAGGNTFGLCAAYRKLGILWLVVTVGCHGPGRPEDHDIAVDPDRSLSARRSAVARLSVRAADDPAAGAALERVAWGIRQPVGLRIEAAEVLLREARESFWLRARGELAGLGPGAWRDWLVRRAMSEGRNDLADALAQSWWREVGPLVEAERLRQHPTGQALAGLSGASSVEAALMDRLQESVDPGGFAASWSLLSRLWDGPSMKRLARDGFAECKVGQQDHDPLSADDPRQRVTRRLRTSLAKAADLLGVLPTTPEGLRRLAGLAGDFERWERCVAAHEGLPPAWVESLALRHLGLLQREASGGQGAVSDEAVEAGPAQLARRLASSQSYRRDPDYRRHLPDATAADRLTAADGWLTAEVLAALGDPAVVGAWFDQLDRDVADPRAEHGGLLTWDAEGRRSAVAFASAGGVGGAGGAVGGGGQGGGRHDRGYVSSLAMMDAAAGGLAHYHYHATRYESGAYAGPSRGDLDFAAANEVASLILTPLDRGRLNVDLVLPGGRWLDLGVIRRGRMTFSHGRHSPDQTD